MPGKIAGLFGLLRVARLRGTRVVWTVHNLVSQDKLHPRIEPWFWRQFAGCVDAAIGRAGDFEIVPVLVAGRPAPHTHGPGGQPPGAPEGGLD